MFPLCFFFPFLCCFPPLFYCYILPLRFCKQARALLRDAPILLLDEATSALDSASEAQVQAAVDDLIAAKASGDQASTVLVIAHRLSTVKRADLVVVLDRGVIVESGTWAELSTKSGGTFASMLKLQGLA